MSLAQKGVLFAHRVRLKLLRLLHGPEPRRYRHLVETIERHRCRRILEIGTWNGEHALAMIRAAARHHPPAEVEYYGFDLFEQIDDEKIVQEISKRPPPMEEVSGRLRATGAQVHLVQGDTRETLPAAVPRLPPMDFVFIDGGHSYETVASDWAAVERLVHPGSVVIFDDYWGRSDAGTDRVVAEIDRARYDVQVLDPEDQFVKEWGLLRVRFVRVTPRPLSGPVA
jgi:predicted O-methyltransferase YrrM